MVWKRQEGTLKMKIIRYQRHEKEKMGGGGIGKGKGKTAWRKVR